MGAYLTDTLDIEVTKSVSAWLGGRLTKPIATGTWAIACLLLAIGETRPKRRLALPAFLCHNPLAAALYAGWSPVFCDVDPATGTPNIQTWRKAMDSGVDAVLLVHLFGNPESLKTLAHECQMRDVFLIEDACQALGAKVDGLPCGSFGDASVLSFGHTKQIDAGGGAMLASENEELLARVTEIAAQAEPCSTSSRKDALNAYKRRFYNAKIRMQESGSTALAGLADDYVHLVPSRWQGDCEAIISGLAELDKRTVERRRKASLYRQLLSDSGVLEVGGHETSSPWRFCFRLPGIDRSTQESIADRVRANGVNLSNWYLPLPWMQTAQKLFQETPGSTTISTEIFQFWLDETTTDQSIREAVQVFKASMP